MDVDTQPNGTDDAAGGKGRRLLGYDDLVDRGIDFSREELRRKEAVGDFPIRVYLSKFRVKWDKAEIDRWIESKFEVRDAAMEASNEEA